MSDIVRAIHVLFDAVENATDVPDFFATVNSLKERAHGIVQKQSGDAISIHLDVLKMFNLAVAKFHYVHGHDSVVSSPVGFMMDPTNNCNLGCPGCWNSTNTDFVNEHYKKLSPGVMKEDTFTAFIRNGGHLSFNAHLYNYSEPFLNKKTPEYIRMCNALRMKTLVSSNLSLPKLDVEAIVASGLDQVMVASDGIRQETYEAYRRGGDVELVFDNVRRLAAAKKKMGSDTPHILWQYLLFAHNEGDVPEAADMAESIGFNEVRFAEGLATVANVDDVGVDASSSEVIAEAAKLGAVFQQAPRVNFVGDLEPWRDMIVSASRDSFVVNAADYVESDVRSDERCDWLYLGTTVDAVGDIRPCCIPDIIHTGPMKMGTIRSNERAFNTGAYNAARRSISNRGAYEKETLGIDPLKKPFCAKCDVGRPLPQVGLGAVHDWFASVNGSEIATAISGSSEVLAASVGWSQHAANRLEA